MSSGIILLSGGLDSLVSLGLVRDKYTMMMALTFDYGQKSAEEEIKTSKKICDFYGIEHEVLKLDWLKKITHTSLVNDDKVPENITDFNESMKAVWVPNRNGLFLNIAASYCDSFEFDDIIIGANKEEAETFSDNTKEFIKRVNAEFEYSTLAKPKVKAPLIDLTKNDIVKAALEKKIPLDLVRSCYNSGEKHCGKCESCIRLKNALLANGDKYFINLLF